MGIDVIGSFFAPVRANLDQLKGLTIERMERVGDMEELG
jgi:hypothetical protein